MACVEVSGDGRRVVVEGDLTASFELDEADSWLVLAFSDGSIVRVLDLGYGGLKIGCMVPGTAEVERTAASSDGESDRLVLEGDVRWLVAGPALHWCREPDRPMAHCGGCGYSASADYFDDAGSAYKDLHCPLCGTSMIDTAEIAEANPNYGYGPDNTLRMT